ncbi:MULTISPECIES: tetratricopeptide repeat protein [Bradyrhizobium]|uniref:tetratricopeptide repeat protein n=1 Tax=Bradyrhizobium TaxID=374 RepID=UPI001EDAAF1F
MGPQLTSRSTMRLRLLGRLVVTTIHDQSSAIALPTRKSGVLLAYLAMSRDYAAQREELATLLWGDCSDQQARQSLRQALAMLRKHLGPSLVIADAGVVRLDGELWSIDAREFEQLSRSTKAAELALAARLFTGDFLAGHHIDEEGIEEWVAGQRTRLQLAAAHLCATFVERPDLVTDPNDAIAAVEQLIALDPLREDVQRLAIALYARYHGRHEALTRAAGFADVLQRELGVGPEKATREMLDGLRSSAVEADRAVAVDCAAAPAIPDAPRLSPAAVAPRHKKSALRQMVGRVLAGSGLVLVLTLGALFELRARQHTDVAELAAGASPEAGDFWRSPSSGGEVTLPNGLVPILVLPFTTLGAADDHLQLTADMLTDDLTNTLSRLPSFRVISQQTARSFAGQPIDVGRLGHELKVRYVLEGSVRRQEEGLRVNVELVDPSSRLSIWSSRIERDGADRQGLRDEIVARLARELQFEMLPIESSRLSQSSDAAALAYRGWAALSEVRLDGYRQALALFEGALEKEPQNLRALTGIGAYHARMGAQVLDTESRAHRKAAIEILRKVLERDPDSSNAHFYLALALNTLPTLPEAMEHLERAIRIDPSDASAHAQIGNGLIRSGRPAEGLAHVRYAIRLSPRDPIMPIWLEFAGNGELELKRYPEAIALFKRSVALNPRYPRGWAGLTAAYALTGDVEESHRMAERLRMFAPTLDNNGLASQFGRHPGSALRAGLQLALAAPADR